MNTLIFKTYKTSKIAILKQFKIFKMLLKSNFNGFHEKIRTTLDFTVFSIQSGFSFDMLNILTYCCFQIFSLQSHVFSALLRIFSGFNGFFRFFSFFYVLLSNYNTISFLFCLYWNCCKRWLKFNLCFFDIFDDAISFYFQVN